MLDITNEIADLSVDVTEDRSRFRITLIPVDATNEAFCFHLDQKVAAVVSRALSGEIVGTVFADSYADSVGDSDAE